MDYFHSFTTYLDGPICVSPKINYHLFSFVHIQVKVWLITPFCEVIKGHMVTISCSQKERK